jgi:hypothetical protein
MILLLADTDPSLQKANDAIDTIDKLGKAGPVTLALVVAIAATAFAVYMMRKNWKLREEMATEHKDHALELKKREEDAKRDADERLEKVLEAAKERREAEKEMLREMVERGHEATQALEGSNRAIEAFKVAMDGYTRRLEELDRSQEKRFDELLRAITSQRGSA